MKFGRIKKKLLPELENIKPLLKRIADFYLYGSLGYGLTSPEKISGVDRIPDIRRAEIRGIKDALSKVIAISDDRKVKDLNAAKDIIIQSIKELPSDNEYYSFGKERVISIVEHFIGCSKKTSRDLSWNLIFLKNNELLVPGNSEKLSELIYDEKKIYWKIYSFLSQIKKFFLKDTSPKADYFYSTIHLSHVIENFELTKKEVQSFIFTRLSLILETFYPSLRFEGTRIKTSISPPLFFFVLTSNDIICLFLHLDKYDQTMLFLLPISHYSEHFGVVHSTLISRYICFLEGGMKEEYFKPLVFWVKRRYLQNCIPPDAKPYFSGGGITLFFSGETGFFFQSVREGEPYYRVTMLPQEYLSKLFNPKDETEEVKNSKK